MSRYIFPSTKYYLLTAIIIFLFHIHNGRSLIYINYIHFIRCKLNIYIYSSLIFIKYYALIKTFTMYSFFAYFFIHSNLLFNYVINKNFIFNLYLIEITVYKKPDIGFNSNNFFILLFKIAITNSIIFFLLRQFAIVAHQKMFFCFIVKKYNINIIFTIIVLFFFLI